MSDDRPPEFPDKPEDESADESGRVPPLGGTGANPPGQFPPLGGGGGFRLPGQTPPSGGGTGGNSPTDPANPFAALFGQLGAGADMNALVEQLQSAFAMFGGPGAMFGGAAPATGSGVNWDVTKDTARKTVATLGPDPSPDTARQREVKEAVSIAEVWLDQATSFPQVSSQVSAWSRAEWIENTMAVWQRLVEPVAAHIADAMENALTFGDAGDEASALPGMAGMEQMLRPMLRTSGASMFGLQLGQGLGQLATEVVGATDIGLPLSEPGHVALLPTNVAAFGEGLEQNQTDVRLYLALRECARQRLFAAAGWLREQMLSLVEQYARGITIDTSALEEAVSQIDPNNLAELGEKLEGGLFEPTKTPEQLATLERLETMLALVEGWVDEVVTQATAQWMPAAAALAETVRRSRASGGPAEATFATLVGLELRPRRMRDAANLWAALRDARGTEGRDAVWSHPDLLPTAADLDDPLGYTSGEARDADQGDEFDAALAELLDSEAERDGDQRPDTGETGDGRHADEGPQGEGPQDEGQAPRDA
jgi:putative hydrolase